MCLTSAGGAPQRQGRRDDGGWVHSFVLACHPGSASWLCATPAPAFPGAPVAAPTPPLSIRASLRLPLRLKNAVVTDSPADGQETLLLEGEWIGESQVLMCLWRSCRTCALALVRHLPARSWSPVAPDAVHRGTLPGDAGRSVPGRRPSEHNKCISMQSCIRRFCVCNSAEQLLLPAHLLLLREACADSLHLYSCYCTPICDTWYAPIECTQH